MVERLSYSHKDKARLALAMKVAAMSKCVTKHGAALYRGGSVLALGINTERNDHDFVEKSKILDICSTHAEMSALSRVKDAKGATIYVARVNRAGEARMSRPCAKCYRALEAAGVRRVVYTEG